MKCFDDERLDYNPETGVFTWLIAPSGRSVGSIAGGSKSNSYVRIKLDGKMHQAHRLAWNTLYPDDLLGPCDEIDHIDHDRTNNRAANLRKVSKQENMQNKSMYRRNTSGIVGVGLMPECSLWRARIRIEGTLIEKHFRRFEDACSQRIEWEVFYAFHKNHGVNING